MSRGVKDLRELICVSRLDVRDSDEELTFSDDEGRFSRLSLGGTESRLGSTSSRQEVISPDSGFDTNGRSWTPHGECFPQESQSATVLAFEVQPPKDKRPKSTGWQRDRRKKTTVLGPTHDLPKPSPLPPLRSEDSVCSLSSRPTSSSSSSSQSESVPHPALRGASGSSTASRLDNYDDILTFLDATYVSDLLAKANETVSELSQWCYTGENFVFFAHFWLTDFPTVQRLEMFQLEYSIILDHLNFAFQSGIEAEKVSARDLKRFLVAVFREYPAKLLTSKGSHLYLDYLDILTSDRQASYKKLLADVKCSTTIKEHAQIVLAIRSFVLVSVWAAVVNFYRCIVPDTRLIPLDTLGRIRKSSPTLARMHQAIRNGFVDVVHYMLQTNKLCSTVRDNHNRNLVFTAVMHNQPKILHYFLMQVKPPPDVNLVADTGNTALHAAANSGNVDLIKILCLAPNIRIDVLNTQCEGATPLHLAVMHGHTAAAEVLLDAKADPTCKMGDLTVFDIARDFEHEDILKLLMS